MLFAIDVETNKNVSAKYGDKDRKYKCELCNEQVILKRGKKIKPYFSHKNNTNCQKTSNNSGESSVHMEAKSKLVEMLNNKYNIYIYWRCPKCKNHDRIKMVNHIEYLDGDLAVTEFRRNNFIADIAMINDSNIKYIFEVYNTHKTVTETRPEPWFEIDANEILDLDRYDKIYLTCIRESDDRHCDKCLNKIKRIRINNWIIETIKEL